MHINTLVNITLFNDIANEILFILNKGKKNYAKIN